MGTSTLEEVRAKGLDALSRELGPVGMVRFLQQFNGGRGDYSKERHELLDNATVDTIVSEIESRRTPSDSQ